MIGYVFYALRYLRWGIGDLLRRRRRPPDYVVFLLEGAYPMLPQPSPNILMRWLRPPRVSLYEIGLAFRTIAADERVRGVVLHLRELDMPAGQLDSLRDMISGLRAAGKRVITYSYSYSTGAYYVASAADEILLTSGSLIDALGVRRSYMYLADALQYAGIKAEFVQVSPFKSAGDIFTRSSMSDEVREMANWLIDATYGEIVRAIAAGRRLDEAAVRAMLEQTPCTDLQAKQIGLVDELIAEEDLPQHLKTGDKPARLETWEEAQGSLRRRPPAIPGRYVAVLTVEGAIVDGYSEHSPLSLPIPLPFVYEDRAGDLSVVETARRVLADPRAAAVILYVDSGGGSATASEAMRSALAKIAARKPLIVAMGSVAASGGYWVSMPARAIYAQPNTITGSIGVLMGKFSNAGLLEKLLVNQETIRRGKPSLTDFERSYSDEERQKAEEGIERLYAMFLDRVSTSRKMAPEAIDAIGRGRVWTGRQALANGLVDELGGLERAVAKARELANLSERAPLRIFYPINRPSAPLPDTTSALAYGVRGLRMLSGAHPLYLCPFIWIE
jgi:protease IV